MRVEHIHSSPSTAPSTPSIDQYNLSPGMVIEHTTRRNSAQLKNRPTGDLHQNGKLSQA